MSAGGLMGPKWVGERTLAGPIACASFAVALSAGCGEAGPKPAAGGDAARVDAAIGADAGLVGECQTHAQCVELHAPHFICRASDHTCVSLLSPECTLVRGDDTDDSAVFVGVLAVEGAPLFGVSDLARNDFTSAVSGLPSLDSAQGRPFVLIGCSFAFGEDPLPPARYLVETLGVPAIVGAQGSQTVISVAQSVTIPAGTLLMSPLAQSDLISELKDDDLVFRTSPTTSAFAPQLAAMLQDLESQMRAQGEVGEIKVALISTRDAYGLSLSAATTSLLRFNGGLSADENEAKGRFLAVSYDSSEPNYDVAVAERVVDFGASIVIALTPAEQRAFVAIEQAWPEDAKRPPHYIVAGGFSSDTLGFVTAQPDELRQRVRFGSSSDPTRPLYRDYQQRVVAEFGDAPGLLSAASTYDATYALALAIVASDTQPPTGGSIARALRRLVGPDHTINVVPSQISSAVALLREGKVIDLEGVSGPLNFDANGDVTTDGSVECLVRDEATGEVSLSFSGQSYRAASGKLEGAFECE